MKGIRDMFFWETGTNMTQRFRHYAWSDCPDGVRRQVLAFVAGVTKVLGTNLIGVYLHGSLASGCFNPRTSDIDLLVVTRRRVGRLKHGLAALALATSSKPCPIEVTSFSAKDLDPWRYPTPFDFHFSEDWRAAYESGSALRRMGRKGEDPAAQITEARARGVALVGGPIKKVLPVVPRGDFLDSILSDLRWALRKLKGNPVMEGRVRVGTYLVLNACRVLAFLETGRVLSKAEGGDWALRRVPTKHAAVIRNARRAYGRGAEYGGLEATEVRSFVTWATGRINSLNGSKRSEINAGKLSVRRRMSVMVRLER
jgi:predicted nucleotidyltransferase